MYYTLTKPDWLERIEKNEKNYVWCISTSLVSQGLGMTFIFLKIFYDLTPEIKSKELCMRKYLIVKQAYLTTKILVIQVLHSPELMNSDHYAFFSTIATWSMNFKIWKEFSLLITSQHHWCIEWLCFHSIITYMYVHTYAYAHT